MFFSQYGMAAELVGLRKSSWFLASNLAEDFANIKPARLQVNGFLLTRHSDCCAFSDSGCKEKGCKERGDKSVAISAELSLKRNEADKFGERKS